MQQFFPRINKQNCYFYQTGKALFGVLFSVNNLKYINHFMVFGTEIICKSFVFLSFTGSVYVCTLVAAFLFKGSTNATICPTCDENLTCVWDQRCGLDEVCMVRSVSGRQFSTHCIRVRQHPYRKSLRC